MNKDNRISKSNKETTVHSQDEQYQVVLPCEVKDFGVFVSGLLGKPQVLKGEVQGNFEVEYQDIANIYHLVNHRVEQQNLGTLVHLSISVHYKNGTSITHNDIEKFKNYHPTNNTYPIEISLSFTYLLSFPQKSAPEKQTIEVILSAEPNKRERNRYFQGGLFEYKIEYTDRTWATDISGLLQNHGKIILEEHSTFKGFVRRYSDEIVENTGLTVMILAIVSWVFSGLNFLDFIASSNQSPTETIISISKYFLIGTSILVILWLLILAIRRIAIYYIHIPCTSYILLVEADKKLKAKSVVKERNKWLKALLLWSSNIIAGLVTHYLIVSGYFL